MCAHARRIRLISAAGPKLRRTLWFNGIAVHIYIRAIGGLGWTWSYEAEGHQLVQNEGNLAASEAAAYDAAISAATKHFGGPPTLT